MKTLTELLKYKTLKDRFNYLKCSQFIGDETFGSNRYLNQALYKNKIWRDVRRKVILRDNSNELSLDGYPIRGQIIVHHINPITIDDIVNGNPFVYDMNNLISCSQNMHNAIHYNMDCDTLISLYFTEYHERMPGDTTLWR